MEFKKWLLFENAEFDEYEEAIAAYTFYHFRQAVKTFFDDGKKKYIGEYMQETWDGESKPANGKGAIRLYMPSKIGTRTVFPKEMVELKICVDIKPFTSSSGAGATQGGGIITLYYDHNILTESQNINEQNVQIMIATIQYQLYHEATHLMSGKVSPENMIGAGLPWWQQPRGSQEYKNGRLNYYTDEGEVKAHARQYAIVYMNKYPGKPYDPNLLIKMGEELQDKKMVRFANNLGNPKIQQQFPQFAAKMQKAHELFHSYMKNFVKEKGYRQYQP
jgi:hypothetical protein